MRLGGRFTVHIKGFGAPFSRTCLAALNRALLPRLPISLASSMVLPCSLGTIAPGVNAKFSLNIRVRNLITSGFNCRINLFGKAKTSIGATSGAVDSS